MDFTLKHAIGRRLYSTTADACEDRPDLVNKLVQRIEIAVEYIKINRRYSTNRAC
jgi:hypothetical protein